MNEDSNRESKAKAPSTKVGERLRIPYAIQFNTGREKPSIPDFIDYPPSVGHQRAWPFTDLPHEIFRKGVLDMSKIPARGVSFYASMDFDRTLKELLPQLDPTLSPETLESIHGHVITMGPKVLGHRRNTMQRYLDWLHNDSMDALRTSLAKFEELRPENAERICDAYRDAMPQIEARAYHLAEDIVASENHLPRLKDCVSIR